MRSLFWLLTLAALAIGVALLGHQSDGYVLWVVPPWRIELSLSLFVLAQIVVLAAVYLLLRAIALTLDLPQTVREFRERRAQRSDERAAGEALRLFWEGRYSQALKMAGKVREQPGEVKVGDGGTAAAARGMAALAGLRAAHALRDSQRIAEWQNRAEAMDGEGWRTARLMGDIRIALDARDFAAAHAALEQLGQKERRQISAQRLALRLAQGRSDWQEMLRIVRMLEKHGALTPDQARPLRIRAQRGVIESLQDDPPQLMRHWHGIISPDRVDPQLTRLAAHALAAAGACAECKQLVEDVLDERWEPVLLEDYAQCEGGDILGRIAHCEKWLHDHPDDAALLRALGRLCAHQQLWGKAQSYLEAALAIDAGNAATHIELARLLDYLERPEDANRHYRAAANLTSGHQIQSRGGRKSV
jgi:HemY protein